MGRYFNLRWRLQWDDNKAFSIPGTKGRSTCFSYHDNCRPRGFASLSEWQFLSMKINWGERGARGPATIPISLIASAASCRADAAAISHPDSQGLDCFLIVAGVTTYCLPASLLWFAIVLVILLQSNLESNWQSSFFYNMVNNPKKSFHIKTKKVPINVFFFQSVGYIILCYFIGISIGSKRNWILLAIVVIINHTYSWQFKIKYTRIMKFLTLF